MTERPILLTEEEAAAAVRLSPRTLRKARKGGALRYILIGRAVRYTMADLESWIDSLRQAPPPCPMPVTPARTARRPRRSEGARIIPFHLRNA